MLAFELERDQNTYMKKIHLTPAQKSNLEIRHGKCKNVKEADRIKAVLLRS